MLVAHRTGLQSLVLYILPNVSIQIHPNKQCVQQTPNSSICHDRIPKSPNTFFNKNDEHVVMSANEFLENFYVVDILNKVDLSCFLLCTNPLRLL